MLIEMGEHYGSGRLMLPLGEEKKVLPEVRTSENRIPLGLQQKMQLPRRKN
jgi:hypothetical protein